MFYFRELALNSYKKETWRKILVDLKILNKIQLGEYYCFIKMLIQRAVLQKIFCAIMMWHHREQGR